MMHIALPEVAWHGIPRRILRITIFGGLPDLLHAAYADNHTTRLVAQWRAPGIKEDQ